MYQVYLRRMISPQFLIQQEDISYLPWLTGAMQFLGCKVPLSSHPCQDFNRSLATVLLLSLPSIPFPLAGAYGCVGDLNETYLHSIQGATTVFYPKISK